MKKFIVLLIMSFVFAQIPAILFSQEKVQDTPRLNELKVMSFNIWVGGGKSIEETANVIKQTSADIVGIQEASKGGKNNAEKIAKDLGWHSYTANSSRTIISRFPVVKKSTNGKGCKIQIGEKRFVWMFNLHLIHCPYEPYQLNGIPYCGAPFLNTAEEAIQSALKSRGRDVEETVADIKEAQKDNCPIFLTGDFNEPSCLDWTEKAAKAGNCKMPVAWPSTKAFIEKAGMKDSYRIKFPDEVTQKGHTWSSLPPSKNEIFERIDFLFFHGSNVETLKVQIVGEQSQDTDIGFDNYPSDHRAVLGTFRLND
ncbi:MAG: endonuclease/exonuclease/phosphatase family protein [Planctomycetaceae bacterium]|jgi:endonuclease/exonuclease/phosphatase family metal-dependent hydrolase|nr:endonuclease/exonuclease/phosphatase family protein [Planctomycetaceae bacterium]